MSKSISSFFDRCYGCLSLRAGVFLNSLCSLVIPYVAEYVALTYVMSEYHKNAEMDVPDRYYHVRVPFLNSPINIFSSIHASKYGIGLAGSYMKLEKLIKYHKYLLYFDVISTPFVVIQRMWRASSKWSIISTQKGPNMPDTFEQDMKFMLTMFAAFQCAYHGIFYMKQIYAAIVATRYQRFLLLSEGNSKAK